MEKVTGGKHHYFIFSWKKKKKKEIALSPTHICSNAFYLIRRQVTDINFVCFLLQVISFHLTMFEQLMVSWCKSVDWTDIWLVRLTNQIYITMFNLEDLE